METHTFVGREAEARVVLANAEAKRSSLIIAEAGLGKSALLAFLAPAFHDVGVPLFTGRVSPFGTFLRELFTGLWQNWVK